jgi:tRNA(Ile)-lysidine synthetase-like protein
MDHKSMIKDIIEFWFPNQDYQKFWFDGSVDQLIIKKYNNILIQAENNMFKNWEEDKMGILALVILFDQFTRNIYRNSEERKKNDVIAVELSLKIINNNLDLEYPLYQRIFFLLPLRHQRNTKMLNLVMGRIKLYEKTENNSFLERFKYATLKNYGDVYDTIKYISNKISEFKEIKEDILDDNCTNYKNKISSSQISEEQKLEINNNLISNIESFYKNLDKNINIGISLSGGVDSMVLLYISKYLEVKNKINKVIAIHLEYVNREEAKYETEYIINWCQFLGVPIYLRKIEHMSRDNGSIDRDFYEEETKRIRFNTYKYVINKEKLHGICLGHHFGDLGENVLMNIFNGRDLLDLFVMDEISIIEEVKILRPMLKNIKDDIFDFAHKNYIPYMKDTTPDWSCRGVLRKKLMPTLVDQYGTGIYNNLAKLGNRSKQWDIVMKSCILEPIISNIIYGPLGCVIPLSVNILNFSDVLWTKILITVFHKMGINMISQKSLLPFIDWVKKSYNTKSCMLRFSNKYMGLIDKDKLYIISDNILNEITSETINMEESSEIILKKNKWEIKISEIISENKDNKFTLDNIIKGKYNYTIESSNILNLNNNYKQDSKLRKLFSNVNTFTKNIPIIYGSKNISTKKIYKISILYM